MGAIWHGRAWFDTDLRGPIKLAHSAYLTHAEFLARACKLANDKARELGWIV